MHTPPTVSVADWEAARQQLLVKEKEPQVDPDRVSFVAALRIARRAN